MSRPARIGVLVVALIALATPVVALDGWEWMNPLPQGLSLHGVWGASPDSIFAVGEEGTIVHGSTDGWVPMESGTSRDLLDVWGAGPDDVFAVGEQGVILHWDGRVWSPMSSGTDEYLEYVWGSGPDNVYAGGQDELLRWDGRKWRAHPTNAGAQDLWCSAPDDVYQIQSGQSRSEIMHWDGSSWQTSLAPDCRLYALWGSSSRDVYASGEDGLLTHWDGASWSTLDCGAEGSLSAIDGSGPEDIHILERSYPDDLVHHWDGLEWRSRVLDLGPTVSLSSLAGIGPGRAILVGRQGCIALGDDHGWRLVSPWLGTIMDLLHFSDESILAVGQYSYEKEGYPTGFIRRWNGTSWEHEANVGTGWLEGIWASGPDDIFVVGGRGSILHWDGRTWAWMNSHTDVDLTSVWGTGPDDVYATGYEVLLHWNGSRWSVMDTFPGLWVDTVWGFPTGELYLLCWDGFYEHSCAYALKQGIWTQINDSYSTMNDIWGLAPDDLYIVWGAADMTYYGGVFHWNGRDWTTTTLSSGSMYGIAGESADRIAVVGLRAIMTWDGESWHDDITYVGDRGFSNVLFLDSGKLMVAGYGGWILKQSDTATLQVTLPHSPASPQPGDTFHLTAHIDNPGAPIPDAPVCFVLEHQGGYWLWPDWDQPTWGSDWMDDLPRIDLPTGHTGLELIPPTAWPDGIGEGVLVVWGAVLTEEMDGIVGRYVREVVRYHE